MWATNRHITQEEQAFRLLIQEFQPLIISIITKKISKKEDVKDVVQNVYIQLWLCRKKISTENIKAIIVNTCKQKIAEYYKKYANNFNLTDLEDNIGQYEDIEQNELEIREDKFLHLETAIENITPFIRQKIFKMNKISGIKQHIVADELNISTRTVKYHIQQALLFIKNSTNIHKKS